MDTELSNEDIRKIKNLFRSMIPKKDRLNFTIAKHAYHGLNQMEVPGFFTFPKELLQCLNWSDRFALSASIYPYKQNNIRLSQKYDETRAMRTDELVSKLIAETYQRGHDEFSAGNAVCEIRKKEKDRYSVSDRIETLDDEVKIIFKRGLYDAYLPHSGDVDYGSAYVDPFAGIKRNFADAAEKYAEMFIEQVVAKKKQNKTKFPKDYKGWLVQGFGDNDQRKEYLVQRELIRKNRERVFRYSCTCPDFTYRKTDRSCKHIKKVL